MKTVPMRLTLFLLPLVLMNSCKARVGGPCEYKVASYDMKVMELVEIDGKLEFIDLVMDGEDGPRRYRFNAEEMVKYNLDLEAVVGGDKTLKVTLDEITKGTCTPYILKDIKTE